MQFLDKSVAILALYQRYYDDLKSITFELLIYISTLLHLLLLKDYCTELKTILDYSFCLSVGGGKI